MPVAQLPPQFRGTVRKAARVNKELAKLTPLAGQELPGGLSVSEDYLAKLRRRSQRLTPMAQAIRTARGQRDPGKPIGRPEILGGLEQSQTEKITQPVATIGKLDPERIREQLEAVGNNPLNALAFSSFVPGEGQVDPRDATYWQNVNNLLFNTQQRYSGLREQGRQSSVDYEKALSDLRTAQGQGERSLAEQAMRQGLARSGTANRRATELAGEGLRATEDVQTSFERSEADRRSAMSQAIQEFISGESGAGIDAISALEQAQREQAAEAPPAYDQSIVDAISDILTPGKTGGGKGRKGRGGKGKKGGRK